MDLTELNRRQKGTVRMICKGLPNREIAAVYGVTSGTVKSHISRIYRKLGIRNRTQIGIKFSYHEAEQKFTLERRQLLAKIDKLEFALDILTAKLRVR